MKLWKMDCYVTRKELLHEKFDDDILQQIPAVHIHEEPCIASSVSFLFLKIERLHILEYFINFIDNNPSQTIEFLKCIT